MAEVIFSPEIFEVLKNGTYGSCSPLQTIALESVIGQLYEQLMVDFELSLQLSHIKNELRVYLSTVIEFDRSSL